METKRSKGLRVVRGACRRKNPGRGRGAGRVSLRGHCVGSVMSRLCVGVRIQGSEVRDWPGWGEKLMGLRPGH